MRREAPIFLKNQFRCFSHLIDIVGLMVLAVRRKRCMSVKTPARSSMSCTYWPLPRMSTPIANRQPEVPRPFPYHWQYRAKEYIALLVPQRPTSNTKENTSEFTS